VALRGVIFIGGGGHAAVCRDVFESAGRQVIGHVSAEAGDLDLPHLGVDGQLEELVRKHTADVFVAIGANRVRLRLLRSLSDAGMTIASAVDEGARVAPSVTIGAGTVIMPGAVINARTIIGEGVIINTSASVDHDGQVADGAHIAPGSHLAGGVRVGEGAFVGVGVSVIPNCRIGEWSIIGAGAAVIGRIESHCTAVGVPARLVRTNVQSGPI
jgi:UDP-perosamine 4-acetyltransferase